MNYDPDQKKLDDFIKEETDTPIADGNQKKE